MIESKKKNSQDSGVSETIGFILIFGITITGIALVMLYGYPALLAQQQEANIRNMERNMIVLQSDVNALAYKSVPYKETTMQVSGGVLSVEEPDISNSYIKISDDDGPLLDTTLYTDGKFSPGELQFLSESGEVSVALENGAVVKWQIGETGQGYQPSVMLSKPRWFIDTYSDSQTGVITRTMVITLIQVDSANSLAKSGICTVQMEIEPLNINDPDGNPNSGDETNYIDKSPVENPVRISTTINNRYYKAWANYFENDLNMDFVVGSPTPTWERNDINRLVVKAYKVNVIGL